MKKLTAIPMIFIVLAAVNPGLPPCHKLTEMEKLIRIAKDIEKQVPLTLEAPTELVLGKLP